MKAAAFANSSGWPSLPNELNSDCLRVSSSTVELFAAARAVINSVIRSVSVQPGKMELKRMPSRPSSNASDLVRPMVAERMLFDKSRLEIGCLTDIEVTVSTLAESDFRKYGN